MRRQYLINNSLVDNFILIIICSVYCMISLSFVLPIEQATYFLFICIALSFGSFLLVYSKKQNRILNDAILFAIVTMVHYLLFYGTVKLVDSLIVISVVFFAAVVYTVQLSRINFKAFLGGAVICLVILIVKAKEDQYYTHQQWLQYVYMNPNMAGAVVLNLLVVIILGVHFVSIKWLRVVLWGISLYSLTLILKTNSRSAFFSAVIYIVLILLENRRTPNRLIQRLLFFSPIIVIPIVTIYFSILFSFDVQLLDKPLLSGREHLWLDAVLILLNNILKLRNDFTSGLNTVLRLSYLSGIVGVALFFKLFINILIDLEKSILSSKKPSNPAVLALGVIFLNQSFESILVSGSYAICYISMSLLGLAKKGRGS